MVSADVHSTARCQTCPLNVQEARSEGFHLPVAIVPSVDLAPKGVSEEREVVLSLLLAFIVMCGWLRG